MAGEINLPPVQVPQPQVTSGLKTTEFYAPALVAALVGIAIPIVNKKYNLELDATNVTNAALGIMAAAGAIIGYVVYIISRMRIKVAHQEAVSKNNVAVVQASVQKANNRV